MAMSDKEAAARTIRELPDDASWDDILEALLALSRSAGHNGSSAASVPPDATVEEGQDGPGASVSYHLERRGWATVLVPDRPVPPITADIVNDLIEEVRREREDRWLAPTKEDGE
jgi:hypothetical protein